MPKLISYLTLFVCALLTILTSCNSDGDIVNSKNELLSMKMDVQHLFSGSPIEISLSVESNSELSSCYVFSIYQGDTIIHYQHPFDKAIANNELNLSLCSSSFARCSHAINREDLIYEENVNMLYAYASTVNGKDSTIVSYVDILSNYDPMMYNVSSLRLYDQNSGEGNYYSLSNTTLFTFGSLPKNKFLVDWIVISDGNGINIHSPQSALEHYPLDEEIKTISDWNYSGTKSINNSDFILYQSGSDSIALANVKVDSLVRMRNLFDEEELMKLRFAEPLKSGQSYYFYSGENWGIVNVVNVTLDSSMHFCDVNILYTNGVVPL